MRFNLITKRLLLQGIVFDFDGTLAKLNIDFTRMRKEVLALIESYDIPFLQGVFRDLFVLEMITAGADLIGWYHPGQDTDVLVRAGALISHIETEAAQRSSLFDGIREMLEGLRQRNIKTGVVTRNCLSAVQMLFPDIEQSTHAVITREQTPHVKPHIEHLLLMLDTLDVAVEHAAMVGDHPLDIKIGKDAGVFTIGVLTGASRREALEQAGADLILNAATDIPSHLV